MNTIFYIAYEFPPLNNGGVLRSAKFAKYLPDFNIKPVVFTLSPHDYKAIFKEFLVDNTLLDEIPDRAEIIWVPSPGIKRKHSLRAFFSIVRRDTSHWQPNLKKAIIDNIEKYKPQAIVVTAPPFSLVSYARKLSKELNLPLIIDMRDAWTYWNLTPYRTYFHYLFTKLEERRCFKHASKIIGTSQQTLKDFKKLHPSIPSDKFHLIPNGFDIEMDHWQTEDLTNRKYRIGYVGSFYYSPEARRQMFTHWSKKPIKHWLNFVPRKEDWLYRSPYYFFKTVSKLIKHNPSYIDKIEICFAGHKPEWFDSMVTENRLESVVKHLGLLSLNESLTFQKQCDALLLTSAKVVGGNDYSIAGKTYEYISIKKPIVSFVCEGAQKDILIKTGIAILCNPDELEESMNKLKELIDGKIHLQPDQQYIKSFHRRKLAENFADIITTDIS
nr:glycosyltransferase [uncultured Carboxylicivirga sp.]